ncbi:MAG TPA: MarR family transcriptional regulator [Roseiflexaceae bacterium]
MPDARECAELLLATLPNLMRSLGGTMRQHRFGGDEPMKMEQLRMLEMLGCASFTLGELAARHHVTPSTMSRTVDVLVRKDWVARRIDPHDRRQVILTLTEAGQAARAAMQQHTRDVVTQMIAQLDAQERERLYDGLRILQTLAERTAPRGCDDGRQDDKMTR